jgi:hypothetical protein
MNIGVRILVLLLVVPSIFYFVYWIPFSLIPLGNQRWIADLVSLACAAGAGWFIWSSTSAGHGKPLARMLYGAMLIGGIGFTAGFFGPMIFAPGANQGPLLGLFITGPLGFVLGGIGGLLWRPRGSGEERREDSGDHR